MTVHPPPPSKAAHLPLLAAFALLACWSPLFGEERVPTQTTADSRYQNIDFLLGQLRDLLNQIKALDEASAPTLKTAQRAVTANFEELVAQARQKLERKCLGDFSIDVIARHKTPPTIYGTKSPLPDLTSSIRSYYECQAFSQRKPQLCQELARYQPWEIYGDNPKTPNKPDDFVDLCLVAYISANIIQINLSQRPNAVQLCENLPFTHQHLGNSTLKTICTQMTSKEPVPGCENPLSPTQGEDLRDCIMDRIGLADESICPLIKKAPLSEGARGIYGARCRNAVAYHKAYQGKDAALCGASLVCRMMMGENVCDQHLSKLKRDYCLTWVQENLKDAVAILEGEQRTTGKRLTEATKNLRQRRAQAEALFVQLGSILEDYEPKSNPGFVARRDLYRAIRKKYEQPLKKK